MYKLIDVDKDDVLFVQSNPKETLDRKLPSESQTGPADDGQGIDEKTPQSVLFLLIH